MDKLNKFLFCGKIVRTFLTLDDLSEYNEPNISPCKDRH